MWVLEAIKSLCVMLIVKYFIPSATVDYKITSSDLTFNATTSSLMVTIPILEDSIVEGSESIIVTLTSSDPAILSPPSTCVTIEDNDGEYGYVNHECCFTMLVLATEWLPWLHTSWRDSGYWRVWKTNCLR